VLKKGKPGPEQQAPPLPPHGSAPNGVKSEAGRIKEIYRMLVRRLHPDLRADRDAEVSHFWHDVQEAYGQGNLERLEMLLALTDLQSNAAGDHTSLFQMRSVLTELRKAFKALQRSLGQARKDPAWKFAKLANRQQVRAGIQRKLERELHDHEADLAELEGQIARWKAAADRTRSPRRNPAPQQRKPAQSNTPPPPKMPRQNESASRYTQTGFPF
jgi:septal ring factor EnvC (AmiA/AmiB activator)